MELFLLQVTQVADASEALLDFSVVLDPVSELLDVRARTFAQVHVRDVRVLGCAQVRQHGEVEGALRRSFRKDGQVFLGHAAFGLVTRQRLRMPRALRLEERRFLFGERKAFERKDALLFEPVLLIPTHLRVAFPFAVEGGLHFSLREARWQRHFCPY